MIVETTVGVAIAGLLFRIRQARVRRRFMQQHGHQIETENEAVADAWRSGHPKEKKLLVERRFRPDGALAPTIIVRQRFHRDKR